MPQVDEDEQVAKDQGQEDQEEEVNGKAVRLDVLLQQKGKFLAFIWGSRP